MESKRFCNYTYHLTQFVVKAANLVIQSLEVTYITCTSLYRPQACRLIGFNAIPDNVAWEIGHLILINFLIILHLLTKIAPSA